MGPFGLNLMLIAVVYVSSELMRCDVLYFIGNGPH